MAISYDNRIFALVSSSTGGEVDAQTTFHYRQQEDVVWGTYEGGTVRFGTLLARLLPDGSLDLRYSHINREGRMMAGVCRTTPETLPDGRLRLHEVWHWTEGGEGEGVSVVEEVTSSSGAS